jgi:hypothetical protein
MNDKNDENDKFYTASFDYVFKRVFGDQRNVRILAAFLIAALDLPEEDFHSIVICNDVLLSEEAGYYNTYSLRNARTGREFTDLVEINILEPKKLPAEPDGGRLFDWGRFFKAETPEELAMIAEKDPAIKEAVALVMELNEDDRERLLAHDRWKWEMDHAALRRQSYREGVEEGTRAAEATYKPVIEENQAIKRENEELRRKLREAGLDN